MAEISVIKLNKYFSDFHLLQNISFQLYAGQRIGIVGPNGCGKTTLFNIITGVEPFESGDLVIRENARIALLDQLPEYEENVTVREVLMQAFDDISALGREMREVEAQMLEHTDSATLEKYAMMQTMFENAGGYELEVKYNRMTNGLNIPESMQNRPFMSLSGGEKTRVNLARVILAQTDILLLDEPTNHLDLHSIEWLEDYLASFKGSVLVVSHDRYFLDRAVNTILELQDGAITEYPGNYSAYIDRKQEVMAQLEAAKKRQDKEIARLEKAVDDLHLWAFMGNDKLHKRAFSMEKRLARIDRVQTMRKEHKMKSKFKEADRSGDEVFYLLGAQVGYDKAFNVPFDATVLRGERVAIMGDNGCGKTTLINTLQGKHVPFGGRVFAGAGLRVGYLPQNVEFSHPERNIVDTMLYETRLDVADSRNRLAAYGFRGEGVFKEVSVLSGGEKARLKLCIFMNSEINTLFLDEPTNHLDILTKEWIEDSIDEFSETMIFVSHDRYFINRFATRIWEFEGGEIHDYVGTYEQYQESKKRIAAQNQSMIEPQEKPKKKENLQAKTNIKESRRQKREVEKQIEISEAELEKILEDMGNFSHDHVKLAELYAQQEKCEAELLELYEKQESLD